MGFGSFLNVFRNKHYFLSKRGASSISRFVTVEEEEEAEVQNTENANNTKYMQTSRVNLQRLYDLLVLWLL